MPHVDQPGSELQWIHEAIAGDKQAFGRLYDHFAGQIFRYLIFRVEERAVAADMTEEVFLRAWEKLPHFGREGRGLNFRAWLYRIAHNLVVDHYRTARPEVSFQNIPEPHSGSTSLPGIVERSDQTEQVRSALRELDEVARQVIALRFFSGLNPGEIASLLGLSEGNVRIIQFRGLKKMRGLLGAEDE
ncbi:MAG: sigma-70 family RNA polymerase sigma factor [Anaerolineae bacterium]|nr:sigma-70 family RNA polymerase sigma factor [Anaerolineae bacterium]